jgi:hypothetical protein
VMKVSGIGLKTFEKIKDHITVKWVHLSWGDFSANNLW